MIKIEKLFYYFHFCVCMCNNEGFDMLTEICVYTCCI